MNFSVGISVSIPHVTQRTESGMFSKVYTSYGLCAVIRPIINRSEHEQRTVTVERRYRDFCELYESLKKDFPLSTIPSLPPKRAMRGDKTKDELVEPRRRQLAVWLQYVCSHAHLQTCQAVQSFIGFTTPAASNPNPVSDVQTEIFKKINENHDIADDDPSQDPEKVSQYRTR